MGLSASGTPSCHIEPIKLQGLWPNPPATLQIIVRDGNPCRKRVCGTDQPSYRTRFPYLSAPNVDIRTWRRTHLKHFISVFLVYRPSAQTHHVRHEAAAAAIFLPRRCGLFAVPADHLVSSLVQPDSHVVLSAALASRRELAAALPRHPVLADKGIFDDEACPLQVRESQPSPQPRRAETRRRPGQPAQAVLEQRAPTSERQEVGDAWRRR